MLEQTRPELIVACYGMNDGIYYPYSEDEAAKFQEGMRFLRERAAKVRRQGAAPHASGLRSGADQGPDAARRASPSTGSLTRATTRCSVAYSDWLLAQRQQGWDVVDIHTPMKRYLEAERRRDPAFRLADDGVHSTRRGTGSSPGRSFSTGAFRSEIWPAIPAVRSLGACPTEEKCLTWSGSVRRFSRTPGSRPPVTSGPG